MSAYNDSTLRNITNDSTDHKYESMAVKKRVLSFKHYVFLINRCPNTRSNDTPETAIGV